MDRRSFLKAAAGAALTAPALLKSAPNPPNIVLILADDLGYGDLGCYGSRIRTPNLDTMAASGVLFRHFAVASPVCSPSRAGLLTGRYPVRTGIPTVLTPQDTYGLPDSETTIAQMLKPAGYRTACIGKWHLGSTAQYLPRNRGFDEFYGMPCSNDQAPTIVIGNGAVVEQNAQLETLTQRYTEQATSFIRRSKDSPFFLYLAHTAPHIPLAASPAFRGRSPLGLYGDVVEEMDWSVGQVLQELRANGLDDNTLVVFTSDNGPWFQGSAGKLRGRKGDTFEGGVREPFIARFPGLIPAGSKVKSFASALDMLPTIAGLAGTPVPNRVDGVDLWPVLSGDKPEVDRPVFLYFDGWNLQCARMGQWKLHLARYSTAAWSPVPAAGRVNLPLLSPELYDLNADPGEDYDCAAAKPDIVADIRLRVLAALPTFPDQVNAAWRDTQMQVVYPNTSGALPAQIP